MTELKDILQAAWEKAEDVDNDFVKNVLGYLIEKNYEAIQIPDGNTLHLDFMAWCCVRRLVNRVSNADAATMSAAEYLKEVLPERPSCVDCKGTGKYKSAYGDNYDCPSCAGTTYRREIYPDGRADANSEHVE